MFLVCKVQQATVTTSDVVRCAAFRSCQKWEVYTVIKKQINEDEEIKGNRPINLPTPQLVLNLGFVVWKKIHRVHIAKKGNAKFSMYKI